MIYHPLTVLTAVGTRELCPVAIQSSCRSGKITAKWCPAGGQLNIATNRGPRTSRRVSGSPTLSRSVGDEALMMSDNVF